MSDVYSRIPTNLEDCIAYVNLLEYNVINSTGMQVLETTSRTGIGEDKNKLKSARWNNFMGVSCVFPTLWRLIQFPFSSFKLQFYKIIFGTELRES